MYWTISEQEVRAAQKAWADAIKGISKTYLEGGDYVAAAGKAAGELYGYGHSNVLFKPTKAKDVQFRPMASQAMSYFVGSKAVGDGISEDGGFAINGGKGWSDVVFDNHQIDLNGNVAIAMGNYYFTSAADGSKTKAKLCRICTVFLIVLMASDLSFASQKVPKSGPSALQKCEDQLSKEANRLDLQPQRRLRQFLLEEGPSLLSYHVRETEFSWLAELDVGERHFEPIAGKTAEEAKKNAAIAALQALKVEKSTMDPPSLSSRPPRHLRGRFEFNECEDEFKLKFLGPEEANIHRIRKKSHAKLKVINQKDKHFVVALAGAEKRFMKATYMLQELLAKFPKSKRPKVSLVLD
eukprot:symbB.v1.2.039992.t1/scaffold6920.1/size14603/4